jgi:hypothetical protein
MIVFALGFVGGGAAIWFGKDKIQSLVIGANALLSSFTPGRMPSLRPSSLKPDPCSPASRRYASTR